MLDDSSDCASPQRLRLLLQRYAHHDTRNVNASTPPSRPHFNRPASPNPRKKQRKSPLPSADDLHILQDYLQEGLDIVICGINPGHMSATQGHHFANPTNHFWRCLFLSGLTSKLVPPSEDHTLPELFSIGMTNLVDRPSRSSADLTRLEMKHALPSLLLKIQKYKPRILCIVGKGIWDIVKGVFERSENMSGDISIDLDGVFKVRVVSVHAEGGERAGDGGYGLRDYRIVHPRPDTIPVNTPSKNPSHRVNPASTLIYVIPSTSGRVTTHQLGDKVLLFKGLKDLIRDLDVGGLDVGGFKRVYLDEGVIS